MQQQQQRFVKHSSLLKNQAVIPPLPRLARINVPEELMRYLSCPGRSPSGRSIGPPRWRASGRRFCRCGAPAAASPLVSPACQKRVPTMLNVVKKDRQTKGVGHGRATALPRRATITFHVAKASVIRWVDRFQKSNITGVFFFSAKNVFKESVNCQRDPSLFRYRTVVQWWGKSECSPK